MAKKTKTSKAARDFISHKISILRNEGRSPQQAIAIAHSMARELGFKVKKARKATKDKERRFAKAMKGR